MFKLIKEGELKFPERPETTKEAKDFITKVFFFYLLMDFNLILNTVFKQRQNTKIRKQIRLRRNQISSMVQRS